MTDPEIGPGDSLARLATAIESVQPLAEQLIAMLKALQAELRALRLEREASGRRNRRLPPGRKPPPGAPVVPWQPQNR